MLHFHTVWCVWCHPFPGAANTFYHEDAICNPACHTRERGSSSWLTAFRFQHVLRREPYRRVSAGWGCCVSKCSSPAQRDAIGPLPLPARRYELQFLACRLVTHRSSASSHHATCPCSCVALGDTHLVTSRGMIICPWVKHTGRCVQNTCTLTHMQKTQARFFLYACQITYPDSTNCTIAHFPTASPSDHFLTLNGTKSNRRTGCGVKWEAADVH